MNPTKRRQREIDANRLRQQSLLQRKPAYMTKAQALANVEGIPKPKKRETDDDDYFTFPLSSSLNNFYQLPSPQTMWIVPSSITWGSLAQTPIDLEKLEALKAATPYKPKPQLRVPDLIECITGWRGWTLGKNGLLAALGQSTVWPAKEALCAVCEGRGTHAAPKWDCTCGIWAFKDVDNLAKSIGQYAVRVIGSVSLWGKVIETENGYRAEKAYPKELWLLDDSLEELGLIYDVPVRMIQPSSMSDGASPRLAP